MGLKRPLKHAAWMLAPRLYRQIQSRHPQEFSIGIAVGDSPFELQLPRSIGNPVLTRNHVTDVPASIVADPFMCHDGERWYLFLEVLNHLTRRGEIGLAISADAMAWEYQRIVLAEPFHLSYPHVFSWQGAYYMIPETSQSGSVCLYRAHEFPYTWTRAGVLLDGERYVDSSIVLHDGTWWLFTSSGADTSPTQAVLRLFLSTEPLGPWQEHPRSPIRSGDPHFTRSAGRIIVVGGTPIRFAQDSYPVYGSSVSAFAITKLTPTEYAEEPVSGGPILNAGPEAWNRDGMHHVDAHQLPNGSWIACVDGFQLHGRADGLKG